MIHWKKALTAGFLSLTLFAAPVGTAMAASWWQTLAYGAAAMALAKQQLTKMDDGAKQQMLASTQAKTGVVAGEAYGDRLEGIQRNIVATGMIERQYDVYANPSEDLNAFETIGGVISVNKGMMDALSDDELAFTLCHEMQHGEKRHAVNGVIVEDIDSCMIKFAKCCTPVPGDAIVGFITKGFGVSIHRADCPNARNREDPRQAARWVRVRWAAQEEQPFETTLELDCITRDGLLLDVATVMTTARVRVKELVGKDLPGGHSTFTVRFEVKNVSELETIRQKLLNIRDVTGSRRGQN